MTCAHLNLGFVVVQQHLSLGFVVVGLALGRATEDQVVDTGIWKRVPPDDMRAYQPKCVTPHTLCCPFLLTWWADEEGGAEGRGRGRRREGQGERACKTQDSPIVQRVVESSSSAVDEEVVA